MLKELQIRDFALIKEVELSFYSGFSVLTGETGAGKSIIIDALGLLLGGRASGEVIPSGAKSSKIAASFTPIPKIKSILKEWGMTADQELVLSREIHRGGRNKCLINGHLATVGQLAQLGVHLVDIIGQHDSQSLLNPSSHLGLLDSYGGSDHAGLVQKVQKLYQDWRGIEDEKSRLQKNERERNRRLDLLKHEIEEIAGADLKSDEEENLVQERSRLANLDRIREAIHYVYLTLAEPFEQGEPVLYRLASAQAELERAAALDPSLNPFQEAYAGAQIQLEELKSDLRDYLEQLPLDQERLQEIELRLVLIQNLKRKYGATIQEILDYGRAAEKEFRDLENREIVVSRLQKQASQVKQEWKALARELSISRRKLAADLEQQVENELADLNMANTRFKVQFFNNADQNPQRQGLENAKFMIAPNLGQDLKPMTKIASGGELSRIMLALKTILAKAEQIPTVIFDEIDAGLGGRTAVNLGEKLRALSQFRQVFCITHLPLIASYAANHYFVRKTTSLNKTAVDAAVLTSDQRVQELVRMLGGTTDRGITQEHARELLRRADGS
ncbi:MAG: DNA repair protein RecN [Firmicutes bacterium]|nr:DNA repair protein RecN [Bacillota bacterium]